MGHKSLCRSIQGKAIFGGWSNERASTKEREIWPWGGRGWTQREGNPSKLSWAWGGHMVPVGKDGLWGELCRDGLLSRHLGSIPPPVLPHLVTLGTLLNC